MDARPSLLLSVDFEDWHQLVRRRVGAPGWERTGPALPRQTLTLLQTFAELGVRATFFILGMAARSYPELVGRIAAAGHEIACHGDLHRPVYTQSRAEFAADLRSARETIERLTARTPVGYRAPAFSITRQTPWAYEVLAELGFLYDASRHDTPRRRGVTRRRDAARWRDRTAPISAPHRLELGRGRVLWELPVAVWRLGAGTVPVGGASYWAVMPRALILRGLERAGPRAGLYLHPQEFDPLRLRPELAPGAAVGQRARAAARALQRNAARRRAPEVLRAVAERFRLITYGEAYAQLSAGT